MKLLRKTLHRMRATGDFKVFRFKLLHVVGSEPQRKRQVLIHWSIHSVTYSFSDVLIQWSTYSVKYSFSEVLIHWSTHSVKYSISEVFVHWSTHSVKCSFSDLVIQWSTHSVKIKTREQEKIKQIYLDCSAFAIVFLRANHASATMLQMDGGNALQT